MSEEEMKIVETVDENGNSVKFQIFDIIEFEENEYALLTSPEDKDGEELVVMKLIQEDDGYSFETIEDDDEFERVSNYLESLGEEEE